MSYRISPEAVVPLLARCLVTHGSMEAIQNFITEYNQKTGTRGNLLAERIGEQAKHFGVKPEDIPASGKKATEYTLELLKKGEPLVRTLGTMGEDAAGSANDPQRRYALVEVSTPDGTWRMLHELLIENGLARAHGQAAP